MSLAEDAEIKDAMRQVRSPWLPWLLFVVTVGIAIWTGLGMKARVDRADRLVETFETRTAQHLARMSVVQAANLELEQRAARLAKDSQALGPLQLEAKSRAEKLEAKRAALTSLRTKIQEKMKRAISARWLKITAEDQVLHIDLAEQLLFNKGALEPTDKGAKLLIALGSTIATTAAETVEVEAHVDSKFGKAWTATGARATSVAKILAEQTKLPRKWLVPIGYGAARPIASNRSWRGRAKNRRIRISVKAK